MGTSKLQLTHVVIHLFRETNQFVLTDLTPQPAPYLQRNGLCGYSRAVPSCPDTKE